MKRAFKSDAAYLLSFFVIVIVVGTFLLMLPAAWAGRPGRPASLSPVDALFTSTSAVCVTGLTTVDTADYSRFGQLVILGLIQVGGLGIVSFTSFMLILPGGRLPFRRLRTIRSFSIQGVENDPFRILRSIVVSTFLVEVLGAVALAAQFARLGQADPIYLGIFHAISAFCNAGFSVFPDSLERFKGEPVLLGTFAVLIATGGIGFIVLQDIARRIRGKKRILSYHSKLMLSITAILILAGAGAFWILEKDHAFAGMSGPVRAMNALFQSVTPRTAGFNAVHQAGLRQPSKFITILLMFIGGAPGSIAGGVKIATAYVVLLVMLKRANERGEINSIRRRLTPETINSAVIYFIKAAFLLIFAAGILSVVEAPRGVDFGHIAFEVTSAFGTVGLSLDFTAGLSTAGKLVIIGTMFTGRVGLLAFLFLGGSTRAGNFVYPEAEILIG